MCEFAVVVVDTVNTDFYLNCQCYKAGDVIEVVPDGWNWGKLDLSFANWRVIKFPGLPASAMTQFLSPQIPTDPNNPSKTLLRRGMSFNYAALAQAPSVAANAVKAAAIAPFIANSARPAPTLSIAIAAPDIAGLTVAKAIVADPSIIGNQPTNIVG